MTPVQTTPPSSTDSSLLGKRPHAAISAEDPALKRQKIEKAEAPDFSIVPNEVIQRILSFLKAFPLVCFGATCKRFFWLEGHASLWQELCLHAKLSVKEDSSYREEFLSAIANDSSRAYMSRARFFTDGTYIGVNKALALKCLYHVTYKERGLALCKLVSEIAIEAVLQKRSILPDDELFDADDFPPGEIDALYDELDEIIAEPNLSKSAKISARLFKTLMEFNDRSPPEGRYSSTWHDLNRIRLDEEVNPRDRVTAKYLLCSLFYRDFNMWEQQDFVAFHRNPNNELSGPERIRLLKECVVDKEAPLWIHQAAKFHIASAQASADPETSADQEAYEMLESLRTSTHLTQQVDLEEIERLMSAFRDQGRVESAQEAHEGPQSIQNRSDKA